MVKPDGTGAHSHSIYNFNATEMSQEGNSTTRVLKGTATVTMKEGPVTDVPLTIKVFNNAVVGLWIGPDKVASHFGTGPVYGTLSTSSKAAMKSMDGTSGSVASNQTSAIKMSAQEVNETYRWSTSDGINPTLKMTANADNAVQIANPTDAKHELVIESNGKELASSGDIAPNGSGQLAFKPTAAGTFEYHCEYHPDTMKGTVEVAAGAS
jgi:plastocyanin